MIQSGKLSLVEEFIAACSCQFTTSGLAQPLGQSYIIEHNVSIIQLPLKHNSYISRNCWHSIIQEALGIIHQGLMRGEKSKWGREKSIGGGGVNMRTVNGRRERTKWEERGANGKKEQEKESWGVGRSKGRQG